MKKICKKCGRELDITDFVKNKNCKDGYEGTCKFCKNQIRQERYLSLYKKIPSTATKVCKRCGAELPYARFQVDLKAKDGYRNVCKECDGKRIKARREFNKRHIPNHVSWARKAARVNNRCAKISNDKISGNELRQIYLSQNQKCAYCHVELGSEFQVEHKIPLSRGGRNTIDNICLSCADFNRLKWTRTHDEFITFLEEYKKRI